MDLFISQTYHGVEFNHPNEIVDLDQQIKVVTLDFDENKTRIQLGLKQLTEHPWESLDKNLKNWR